MLTAGRIADPFAYSMRTVAAMQVNSCPCGKDLHKCCVANSPAHAGSQRGHQTAIRPDIGLSADR